MKLKNLLKEATDNQAGMHKDPFHTSAKLTDLSNDKNKFLKFAGIIQPNKSKMGQAIVMNKVEAFIEACIAPNKFKVRLIKDS